VSGECDHDANVWGSKVVVHDESVMALREVVDEGGGEVAVWLGWADRVPEVVAVCEVWDWGYCVGGFEVMDVTLECVVPSREANAVT
jgi:hypothetical protein